MKIPTQSPGIVRIFNMQHAGEITQAEDSLARVLMVTKQVTYPDTPYYDEYSVITIMTVTP